MPKLADFVMTTEYAADIPASCAFEAQPLTNVLGDYLAQRGMTRAASPKPRNMPT